MKRPSHWYIVISLLLQPLQQRLIVQAFEIALFFIRSIQSSNNFGYVVPNLPDGRTYETKYPTHVGFLVSLFVCRVTSTLKTFLLLTIPMLSRFQSPVNCRNRKVKGNCRHKVNCRWELRSSGMLCSVD